MTAKIKLNAASGGGSFSLQAPSSSANNRVFTLPDSADATLLTSTSATGKVLQVVSATSTTETSSSATSHTDTNLSCSITTTSSSNKVYVSICQSMYVRNSAASARLSWDLVRGSTVISDGVKNIALYTEPYSPFNYSSQMASFVFLDSPGSAATHTYKTTALVNEGNWKAQDNSSPSHIVLMEIEA